VIPSYCVTHGIIFSSSGAMLVKTRSEQPGTGKPELPPELWAWYNMKGDAAALVAHFFVGVLIIVLIEVDVFACCSSLTCRSVPAEEEDLELDEDVVAEAERVAAQGEYTMAENS